MAQDLNLWYQDLIYEGKLDKIFSFQKKRFRGGANPLHAQFFSFQKYGFEIAGDLGVCDLKNSAPAAGYLKLQLS